MHKNAAEAATAAWKERAQHQATLVETARAAETLVSVLPIRCSLTFQCVAFLTSRRCGREFSAYWPLFIDPPDLHKACGEQHVELCQEFERSRDTWPDLI